MADDNGRRAPVLAQPVPAQTHSWVVRFLICAVATVAGLALCTTVTPPMHHSMYQTLGKNDPSTLHPPGVHLLPMPRPFSRSIHVKTALDVDKVTDIKVGTKDGTELFFEIIEVGNKVHEPKNIIPLIDRYGEDWEKTVIYDQVHYLMSTISSRMTSHEIAIEKFDQLDDQLMLGLKTIQDEWETGVDILGVRVYKPNLPESLAAAYAAQAEEKALHKVAIEKNNKIKQENLNQMESTAGQLLRAKAEHANAVEMTRSTHDSEMAMRRESADTEAYSIAKLADANQRLHTPQYIELKKNEAMLGNAKIIMGDAASALFAKLMLPTNATAATTCMQGQTSESGA